jgi:YHS domain-containing protein
MREADHVECRIVGLESTLVSNEVGAMAMVTDPVCGMRVDTDDTPAMAEYEGRTYYFCAQACRDAFVADPGAYAA